MSSKIKQAEKNISLTELKYANVIISSEERKATDEFFKYTDKVIVEEEKKNNVSWTYSIFNAYKWNKDLSEAPLRDLLCEFVYKCALSIKDNFSFRERVEVFEFFKKKIFSIFIKDEGKTKFNEEFVSFFEKFLYSYFLPIITYLNNDLLSQYNRERDYLKLMEISELVALVTTSDIPRKDFIEQDERYKNIMPILDALFVGEDNFNTLSDFVSSEKERLSKEIASKIFYVGRSEQDDTGFSTLTLTAGIKNTVLQKRDLTLPKILEVYMANKDKLSFMDLMPEKENFISPKRIAKRNELFKEEDKILQDFRKANMKNKIDPYELKSIKRDWREVLDYKNKESFDDFCLSKNPQDWFKEKLNMEEFFKAYKELVDFVPDVDFKTLDGPLIGTIRRITKMRYANVVGEDLRKQDYVDADTLNAYRMERMRNMPVSTVNLRYYLFFKMVEEKAKGINFLTFMENMRSNLVHISFANTRTYAIFDGDGKENNFLNEVLAYRLYFMHEFVKLTVNLLDYLRYVSEQSLEGVFLAKRSVTFLRDSYSLDPKKTEYKDNFKELSKYFEIYDDYAAQISQELDKACDEIGERADKAIRDFNKAFNTIIYGEDPKGDFGKEIVGFMKEYGISRRAAADKVGITRTTMTRILNGRPSGMAVSEALFMALCFHRDIYDIIPSYVLSKKDQIIQKEK